MPEREHEDEGRLLAEGSCQARVDPELGTSVWPNGYDLDPDVLHGDYQPIGRPAAQASR
ncbi:MAG TPA: hypothetical protein VNY52_08705 [Solirubrobacteraceae bacterium]|jgi:hypothetical protein|nr:hypothetical protein [Solirubrobacteraceae bacterium]